MKSSLLKKSSWFLFAFLAIGVGLYPILYFLTSSKVGILNAKPDILLQDSLWNIAFYSHIGFGGISLLLGWSQFSARLRQKRLTLHRNLGKAYLAAVLLAGVAAVYLSFYAMGGKVAEIGFFYLGIVWLGTSIGAYLKIRNKDLQGHRNLMVYSYAACFAAVTLRLWMPVLQALTGEFISAYQLVAWISWVPNMIVAYFMVRRVKKIQPSPALSG